MAVDKVLIIDDKMYPEGSKEPAYGRISAADRAVEIKSMLKSYDYAVEFATTGEEGLEKITEDEKKKQIKLILLDIIFEGVETGMQGPTIFREIKKLRGDIPIIIITDLPVRKLPGEEDIFREFMELGASLYIEKKYFSKRGDEQVNFINAILEKKDIKYFLKYKAGLNSKKEEILDIDIAREEKNIELSILKNPHRIIHPLSDYMEQLIEKFPEYVHWTENRAIVNVWGDSLDFQKAIFKLNDTIMRSSAGRIPNLVEKLGRTGCKLNDKYIKKVKEI